MFTRTATSTQLKKTEHVRRKSHAATEFNGVTATHTMGQVVPTRSTKCWPSDHGHMLQCSPQQKQSHHSESSISPNRLFNLEHFQNSLGNKPRGRCWNRYRLKMGKLAHLHTPRDTHHPGICHVSHQLPYLCFGINIGPWTGTYELCVSVSVCVCVCVCACVRAYICAYVHCVCIDV